MLIAKHTHREVIQAYQHNLTPSTKLDASFPGRLLNLGIIDKVNTDVRASIGIASNTGYTPLAPTVTHQPTWYEEYNHSLETIGTHSRLAKITFTKLYAKLSFRLACCFLFVLIRRSKNICVTLAGFERAI
jgi:hypothetical protein